MYAVPAEGSSRAAFVASRKVGGAVARNRARRVLREAWRALAPRFQEGHRVVLVARPEIAGARTPELIEEIGEVLTRAGVIV